MLVVSVLIYNRHCFDFWRQLKIYTLCVDVIERFSCQSEVYMPGVILIRPVWKHGPRSLVWMRDFGNSNSLLVHNLDRVYLTNQIYSRAVLFPSKSIYTGARKMVNYTCAGLSQEKFCWRLKTILTCKSFVGYEYRGERLIELYSSWFPPKFPSG